VKSSEKPRFYGQNKLTFSTLPFSSWVVSTTWLHVGAPQKILEKINLKPILNKTSPRTHTKSEFNVFGVPGKLVKYVVHLSKRQNAQTAID
jgi:hypothetical protein